MIRQYIRRSLQAAGVVIALALIASHAAPAAHPAVAQGPVYGTRGPYAVGMRDYVIEGEARPLAASVWYPAQGTPPSEPSITYEAPGVSVEGRALRGAPPDASGGPYPLVVFSHGAGGFRFQSTYFTEHLASYGFVVIATEHPGSTLTDPIGAEFRGEGSGSQAAGGVGPLLDDLALNFALRPLDVQRAIAFAETLTAEEGDLAGAIDTSTVAVTGHSFGGYTALATGGARLDFDALETWCAAPQLVRFDPSADPVFVTEPGPVGPAVFNCLLFTRRDMIAETRGLDAVPEGPWPATTDTRIRAIVALAPWNAAILGPEGLAAVDIPTMIQVGTVDETTPPAIDAYRHYTLISSDNKALVAFESAGHLLFVNGGMNVDDPAWDMGAAHTLVTHFATAFLRATLYDDPEAAAALAPQYVDFEDVLYHRSSASDPS